MKKSTLLSLLTAGAVIATTAGTYAVWDTVTATSSGTISVAKPTVIVNATDFGAMDMGENGLGAQTIDYTKDVTFTVEGVTNGDVDTMTLVPEVKNGDAVLTAADVDVDIKKGGTSIKTDTAYIDSAVAEGANTYTIVVTVKNKTLASANLTVSVKGTLSKAAAV